MDMREPDFVDECYADKDLSQLQKLTLVIPTYNRNYYLSRCLWYHAHFPFGEIIVADSSPEEKKVVNRETVAKIRSLFGANIRYLEYEPETDKYGGDIYRKWGDAVQQVETEYSIICIDKSILIPSAVLKSLIFLESHPEYIASRGREALLYERKYNPIGRYYFQKASNHPVIEGDNAAERMRDVMELPSPWPCTQLFSLTRTEAHKKIHNLLIKYAVPDIRYGEIILGFFGYLYGKGKISEEISSVRDIRNISVKSVSSRKNMAESSTTRYMPLTVQNKEIPEFFSLFKKCLLQELSTVQNANGENTPDSCSFLQNLSAESMTQFDSDTSKGAAFLHRYAGLYRLYTELIPLRLRKMIVLYFKESKTSIPLPPEPIVTKRDDELRIFLTLIQKFSDNEMLDKPIV